VDKNTDEKTDGWTNRRMDKQAEEQTKGQADSWTGELTVGWAGLIYRQMVGHVDR
jgi:hypothetical protein